MGRTEFRKGQPSELSWRQLAVQSVDSGVGQHNECVWPDN
jgi:hypothetical protein